MTRKRKIRSESFLYFVLGMMATMVLVTIMGNHVRDSSSAQQLSNTSFRNTFAATTSFSSSSSSSWCIRKLDELDHVFDQRRDARNTALASSTKNINHESWDWYESESVCLTEERFGSDQRYMAFGDGPKFICGVDLLAEKAKSSEGCLVYSVGSNNQIHFEKSVKIFMGCETHTFDFTLKRPFVGDQYATFHPWGLGLDDGGGIMKSMETIMTELGHQGRTIDILKIDCEGCEWQTLPPLFDAIVAGRVKVDQLLIELHTKGKGRSLQNFFQAADKAQLRVFHKEYNSWSPSKGCCVEYAFASASFLREANGAYICPR